MAAPTFVAASTGSADISGAWTHTGHTASAVGNLVILQVLQDGTTANAVTLTAGAQTNVESLSGSGSNLTLIDTWAVGSPTSAWQYLWIGRATSASSAMTFSGGNSTSEDVFVRLYEFSGVATGSLISDVIENMLIQDDDNSGNTVAMGNITAATEIAQSFTALGNITWVYLKLSKNGSPSDNITIELQTSSGGFPSGTVLASQTIAGSSLPTVSQWMGFSLPQALTVGTLYWIVCSRSGAVSSSNYYLLGSAIIDAYPDGDSSAYNGSVWNNQGHDLAFRIAGGWARNAVGTSATVSDTAVRTTKTDRLALQLVAADDDIAIDAFAGETGGDWVEAVAEYADATGTDGMLQLQTAAPLSFDYSAVGADPRVLNDSTDRMGMGFMAPGDVTLTGISASILKANSPVDNLVIELQTASVDDPSLTVLTSVTVVGSTLPATSTATSFTFDSSVNLTGGTRYWIVIRRTGAVDGLNRYTWDSSSATSQFGNCRVRVSGTWTDLADRSLKLEIGGEIDGGSDAVSLSAGWGVVGFALIGAAAPTVFQPRPTGTFFQNPAVLSKARDAWEKRGRIFVPRLWDPEGAVI